VVAPTPQTVVGTIQQQTTTLPKGDAAAGKQVFASNGCGGCHTYKAAGSNGKVGPNLDNLAADAKKANQGTLDQYTEESIKNPGAYVVSGFPNGVMPAFTSLSNTDLANLVAFLTQSS
jgi:cytochrome c oxidase subunit 2